MLFLKQVQTHTHTQYYYCISLTILNWYLDTILANMYYCISNHNAIFSIGLIIMLFLLFRMTSMVLL